MPDPRPEVLDFLLTRRSHTAKTLTGPGPDGDALIPLLTAAARAPDHGKLEPWRFVVIGAEAQDQVCAAAMTRLAALGQDEAALEKSRLVFSHGATIVAVISSPKSSEKIPVWEQELSAGAVCLGLVNAAHASGWGANWLTGPLARDRAFLEETLGCAAPEWAAGFIHIGAPQITPAERDRPQIDTITTWL